MLKINSPELKKIIQLEGYIKILEEEKRLHGRAVTMKGSTLSKLTNEERNNLIDQVGSIEVIK